MIKKFRDWDYAEWILPTQDEGEMGLLWHEIAEAVKNYAEYELAGINDLPAAFDVSITICHRDILFWYQGIRRTSSYPSARAATKREWYKRKKSPLIEPVIIFEDAWAGAWLAEHKDTIPLFEQLWNKAG
jgi:hypothetical protein